MSWTFYNSTGQRLSSAAENISGRSTVKAWVRIDKTGAIVSGDYKVASITDNSTGNRTIVFDTAFANTTYVPVAAIAMDSAVYGGFPGFNTYATGSVVLLIRLGTTPEGASVAQETGVAIFGDQ